MINLNKKIISVSVAIVIILALVTIGIIYFYQSKSQTSEKITSAGQIVEATTTLTAYPKFIPMNDLGIKEGDLYSEVRQVLIKDGWTPVLDGSTGGEFPEIVCGQESFDEIGLDTICSGAFNKGDESVQIFVKYSNKVPKIYNDPFTVSNTDPACDGEKNQYYDLGFGIEHSYEGDIQKGKHIKMILSCDHKKLTITGAVEQTIQSSDEELKNTSYGEEQELVGAEALPYGVDTGSDYNFDGYNDLTLTIARGSGVSALYSFFIFLYDPIQNKFVFNSGLSNLQNIQVDNVNHDIKQNFGLGKDGWSLIDYSWTKENKLYKTIDTSCYSDKQVAFLKKTNNTSSDPIKYYLYTEIKYDENGKVISTYSKKYGLPTGEYPDYCAD